MNETDEKKPLPKVIGKQFFMELNYANARFMNLGEAYRTNYGKVPNAYCVFKLNEIENPIGERDKFLFHIVLRFQGLDRKTAKDEKLDVDFYLYPDEFIPKIKELLSIYDTQKSKE